uniref:OB_Dis3 domain-containing protein n=1 Tax=Glossina pallidipes TaxID=7398 RepID=A0A1A9ZCP1_GLOPL
MMVSDIVEIELLPEEQWCVPMTIDSWPRNSRPPQGHFVRSLGPDVDTENEVILLEHDVPLNNFSEVLNCLPKMPWIITPETICGAKILKIRNYLWLISKDPCKTVKEHGRQDNMEKVTKPFSRHWFEKARQSLQEQINETASIVLQLAEANLVRLQQQEKEINRSFGPLSQGLSEEEAMQNALHEQGMPLKLTEYPSKVAEESVPEGSADVDVTTIDEGEKIALELTKTSEPPLENTKEEQESNVEEEQLMENSAKESESLPNKHNIELEPAESLEVEIDSKEAHRERRHSLDEQEQLPEKADPKTEPAQMWSKVEHHDMQSQFSTANTAATEEHDHEMDQMSLELENHGIQNRFLTKNTGEIEHRGFELGQTYGVQLNANESLKRLDLDGEMQNSRREPEIVQHAPKTIEQQVMALAKEYEMQLKPTDSPTFGFQKVESGVEPRQISPNDVNLTAEEENLHGKITESNRSGVISMQETDSEVEFAKSFDTPISFDYLDGVRPQINEILSAEATTRRTESSADDKQQIPPSGAAKHMPSSLEQQHMMEWKPMNYRKHRETIFQQQELAMPSKGDDEGKTPQQQQKHLGATTAGESTVMTELVMEQKTKLRKEETDTQQHEGKAKILSPKRNTQGFPHQKDINEQDLDVNVFENNIQYPKIAKIWSSTGNTQLFNPQDDQKPQGSHIHIPETEIPQYPQIAKMWIPTTIAGTSSYGESQPSHLEFDSKLDSPNNKPAFKKQQTQQQQPIKQSPEWRSQQEQSETPEYSVVLIESAQEPVGQREPTSQMQSHRRSSNESLFGSQEQQLQQQRQQQENKYEQALTQQMESAKDQFPVVLIESAQEPVGQMEPSLYISPELPPFVPGYLFLRRNSQRKHKSPHQWSPYPKEQAKPLDLEDLPQPATIYMEEMFRKSTKPTAPSKFFPRSSLDRTHQSRSHKEIINEQEFQMQTEEDLPHEGYTKYHNTEFQPAEHSANCDNCPTLSPEVIKIRKRRAMESTHLATNSRLQYFTLVDSADKKTRKSLRRVYKKRITDEERFGQMKTRTTKDE